MGICSLGQVPIQANTHLLNCADGFQARATGRAGIVGLKSAVRRALFPQTRWRRFGRMVGFQLRCGPERSPGVHNGRGMVNASPRVFGACPSRATKGTVLAPPDQGRRSFAPLVSSLEAAARTGQSARSTRQAGKGRRASAFPPWLLVGPRAGCKIRRRLGNWADPFFAISSIEAR